MNSPVIMPESYPEKPSNDLDSLFVFEPGENPLLDPEKLEAPVFLNKQDSRLSIGGGELPPRIRIFDAVVVDPFVEADPANYYRVKSYGDSLDAGLAAAGINPGTSREEVPFNNRPYGLLTEAWLANPHFAAVRAWRSLVPTARALHYLLEPKVGQSVIDNSNQAVPMSKEAAMILRFGDDAVAIRNRAAAMRHIAEDHFTKMPESPEEGYQWLSLASGTAEPAILAAKGLEQATGFTTHLVLADFDKASLDYTKSNVEKYGYKGRFTAVQANILNPQLRSHFESRPEFEGIIQQYDMVEAMGFLEYVYQEGDEVGSFSGGRKRSASEFIEQAYSLVKPGGVLLAGNMVYPRPQANYVFNVVDWPLINARSEETIVKLFQEAGVIDDPATQMELYRVRNYLEGTHVYDIVKLVKPTNS